MTVGEYLASGMEAGINAGIPNVENRAREAMRRAAVAAREAAQIASPSKVWGEMGEQLLEGLAKGILAGTPEAAIDAALAMNEIDDEAAKALRDALRAEQEAGQLAERIGSALVDGLEAQQREAERAAQRLVDAAGDRLATAWAGVSDRFSLEDAREAISDQERSVAEARAALDAARLDPEKAGDVADLEERLSDAERSLQRDNLRLFRMLMDSTGGSLTNGTGGTVDMISLARAAGLTDAEMWNIRNQYTALGNTQSAAANTPVLSVAQQQQAIEGALAKFVGPGNTMPVSIASESLSQLAAQIAGALSSGLGGRLAAGVRG